MVQWATALRNQWVASTELMIGTTPVIKIRTGAAPANCAAADTGTVLATITLPSDWLSAPTGGTGTGIGSWTDSGADATGTMGHFRMYDASNVCWMQGTISDGTDPTADLIVTTVTVSAGSPFTISSFLAIGVGG